MGRFPCCEETGLKKGPWTPEEDEKLVKHIDKHGHGSWRALPKLAELNRCGKSCRLRWTNYLRPDIKRGKFSKEEQDTILHLHAILGNKWSAIANRLPGRTDNEIKNFWNTHLKKRLIQMGYDPITHRPKSDIFSNLQGLIALNNLKELMLDQPSILEGHVVRSQQADAVHYLQCLLQPQPPVGISPTNSINNTNSLRDMEITYNHLMNSLVSMKEIPPNTLQGFINNDTIPFSHLPNLQNIPCVNYQTPMTKDHNVGNMVRAHNDEFALLVGYNENNPSTNALWGASSSTLSLPTTSEPEASPVNNHMGDANSSSSSYEKEDHAVVPSDWPDLLLENPSLFYDEIL